MNIKSGPVITGTSSTADDSLFFAENSVPVSGDSVRRLSHAMTGTSMTLSNVTRYRVFANGSSFIDAPVEAIRAAYGLVTKRAQWASTAVRFSLDFAALMPGGTAPRGKNLRIVVSKNATPATSTISLHQRLDNDEPDAPRTGYPSLIVNSANIPASAVTQPYNIQNRAGAVMAGIYISDAANVDLLRYYDAGGMAMEYTSALQLAEQFELERGTTAVTELFIPVRPSIVTPGVTRLEVSTAAGWAGVTNQIGALAYVPYEL